MTGEMKATAVESPRPAIAEALDCMDKRLAQLDEVVGEMQTRLAGVLRSPVSLPPKEQEKQGPHSPIVERIYSLSELLEDKICLLREMVKAAEV